MVRALYPGSFDPVTCGHQDLVDRALSLFDQVTVGVAENVAKAALFSLEERVELLIQVLPENDRLGVCPFQGLVVDHCRDHGFDVILRGLRTVSDFEYEYQMALTNRHLNPDVETVFVMPSAQYSFVSSSLIKDIVSHGGDVSAFVSPLVEARLKECLRPA